MGERTGWRDPDLRTWHLDRGFDYPKDQDMEMSARHRKWGHVYGTDIDWLYVEYNYGKPLALVDYKLREGLRECRGETEDSSNNMALSSLYTSGVSLPYYINLYIKLPWTFRVLPMNERAQQLAPKKQILTELEYVSWLHELRGYQISEYLASQCDHEVRWDTLLPPKHKSKKSRDKSPYTLFDQHPILQQQIDTSLWEEQERECV